MKRTKEKMSENKAITLISLVVTIIILIILSGVSINMLMGENGIIKKAKQAKENIELAQIEEETALNELYKEMELGGTSGGISYDAIAKLLEFKTKIANAITKKGVPTAKEDTADTMASNIEKISSGNASNVNNVIIEGKTLPVPKGFYYVGGTIDSGAVISDEPADENKYQGKEDVPTGVAYNEDGTVNIENSELKGNQFVWIPCIIENYTKVDFGVGNAKKWDKLPNSAEEVQIEKYGGFYIGRYEAGTSNITFKDEYNLETPKGTSGWRNPNYISDNVISGKITSKPGEIPYYHPDYTTAVELSKRMYNTNSVKSGLVTGTMWDAVMKFIATDKANYSDLKNTVWGNYDTANSAVNYTKGQGRYIPVTTTGTPQGSFIVSDDKFHYGIRTTASTEDVKKNNLYDLAGNLCEWTQEAAFTTTEENYFILRGGSFRFADDVCFRRYYQHIVTNTYHGFRPVLYMM